MGPLLEVKNLSKRFDNRVLFSELSFSLYPQETLSIVGRSGSGKSTLAKILVGIDQADRGEIFLEGRVLSSYSRKELAKKMQLVFQNPHTSLNPLMKIKTILQEPLLIHNVAKNSVDIGSYLHAVSLPSYYLDKYPHQLSGGERQRVCLARTLILRPKVMILDEVLSSLDEVNQKTILSLLTKLQREFSLGYLFITHNKTHASEFGNHILSLDSSPKKFPARDKIALHS